MNPEHTVQPKYFQKMMGQIKDGRYVASWTVSMTGQTKGDSSSEIMIIIKSKDS